LIPSVIVLLKRKLKLLRLVRRSRLTYVAAAFITSVLVNGTLFYLTEGVLGGRHDITFWRSLYWAVVTMATVGYGDIVPKTFWGTVVTVETIVVGIAVFTMMVSLLAEEFMNASIRKSMGLGRLRKVDMLVIGELESCREAVEELKLNLPNARIGWLMPEAPKQPPRDIDFVAGDPADEEVLKRAAADRVKDVVICLSDDSKAVHTVLMLRRLNKAARVVCLANNERSRELLEEAGADQVIPARILGRLLASAAFEPGVAEFLREVTTARGFGDLTEVRVGKDLAGLTVGEAEEVLGRRDGRYSYKALALVRGGKLRLAPPPSERLEEGDSLVMLKALRTRT